jgi:SAM-dependent methyltransferase
MIINGYENNLEGTGQVLLMTNETKKINVGCGRNIKPGWINLDSMALPGVNVIFDLESCATEKIPLPDNSAGEFLLSHVIEHIHNILPMMQELHRVAQPDAKMIIMVPYGSSDDAYEDPTHIRHCFIGSFGYFSQPFYWRADYGYRGDWQPKKITLTMDKRFVTGNNVNQVMDLVMHQRNIVKEMIVELVSIKPIRSPLLELQENPEINIQTV